MLELEPDKRGPRSPISRTPARRRGSIRRTSSITTSRPDGLDGDPVVDARARDLLTMEAGSRVLDETRLTARLHAADRSILEISVEPDDPRLHGLLGVPVGPGFRFRVGVCLPELGSSRPPLYVLLDDLPGAALVSGYALLRRDALDPPADPSVFEGMADLCAGWAHDGVMLEAIRETGQTPTPTGPLSPALEDDDPHGWHDPGALPTGATRRRRRLDVAASAVHPGVYEVDAMFRDSHADDVGVETTVHEYAVQALVDADTRRVTEVSVTPHVLPWTECPAAITSAQRIVGIAVADLPSHVRQHLTGVSTCTHLNDTLRGLADLGVLIDRLSQDAGQSDPSGPS